MWRRFPKSRSWAMPGFLSVADVDVAKEAAKVFANKVPEHPDWASIGSVKTTG